MADFTSKLLRINHQIKTGPLLVIDENGQNLGVLSLETALKTAQEKGLDLVEVNPTTSPPVAKIVDYGKFEYRQRKTERKTHTTHKRRELKIIRIRLKTSANDIKIKALQAERFLERGHRVRLEIFLRGREKSHRDLARTKLQEFEKSVKRPHKIEGGVLSLPSGWAVVVSG